MVIVINITSKNYNSLIFYNALIKKVLNTSFIISKNNYFPAYVTKKTLFSILKSPHVNKTSQEQFDFKVYKITLKIYTLEYLKMILFLNSIKNNFFSDIKSQVKLIISNEKFNYNFFNSKINDNNLLYLTYLDCFGENLFNTIKK